MDVQQLAPLVGTWTTEAVAPALGGEPVRGRSTFGFALGGAAIVQQASADHPRAPDILAVIAPDGDAYLQHYFDGRGVVRLYRMTFDGRCWELYRNATDFSALAFHQHFTAVVRADRITGRWERSEDGRVWELDFELRYARCS